MRLQLKDSPDAITQEEMEAPDKTPEKYQKYSHDQLCHLQSKIMLVAGKAEADHGHVERFTEVSVFQIFTEKFHCN